MISRYAKALAQGKEEYARVLREDQHLLDGFAIGLLSAENSLRMVIKKKLRGSRINPWDVIEVGPALWEWLQPLLLELAELRSRATSAASSVDDPRASASPACTDQAATL